MKTESLAFLLVASCLFFAVFVYTAIMGYDNIVPSLSVFLGAVCFIISLIKTDEVEIEP